MSRTAPTEGAEGAECTEGASAAAQLPLSSRQLTEIKKAAFPFLQPLSELFRNIGLAVAAHLPRLYGVLSVLWA